MFSFQVSNLGEASALLKESLSQSEEDGQTTLMRAQWPADSSIFRSTLRTVSGIPSVYNVSGRVTTETGLNPEVLLELFEIGQESCGSGIIPSLICPSIDIRCSNVSC